MADKIRLQFDFTQEAYDELNELQKATSAPTKAETVRFALRALQWIVEELDRGARIIVKRNEHTQEAVFPFFAPDRGVAKNKKSRRQFAAD
jgi:hypothetical protein